MIGADGMDDGHYGRATNDKAQSSNKGPNKKGRTRLTVTLAKPPLRAGIHRVLILSHFRGSFDIWILAFEIDNLHIRFLIRKYNKNA